LAKWLTRMKKTKRIVLERGPITTTPNY